MATDILDKNDNKVYSIGSIIHNEQAMEKLEKKGLIIQENLSKIEGETFAIIRSHGLPKEYYKKMEENGINIVDATCPFVKKIQDIVYKKSKEEGHDVIIIGDSKHPEVIGIKGWVVSETYIISNEEEAKEFTANDNKKYTVVVQTTFNIKTFAKIKEILLEKKLDLEFSDTICYATNQRQSSAEELSQKVDVMVVVGGKKSSNTKKLAEICKKNCKTILIETKDELDKDLFVEMEYVGIVAGASTPDFVIEEVYDYINKINI